MRSQTCRFTSSALIVLVWTSFVLPAIAASMGPCDIYGQAQTPCVAAFSTTRALYGAYNGGLYQVLRNADNQTTDIVPLTPGGVANATKQDVFCANTTCLISIIYDQSTNGNNLTRAPGGDANPYHDALASAIVAPVILNGSKAYGVFISPATGYRNDNTTGVATGNQSQGIYAVLDGSHYNAGCCFDFGNVEKDNTDHGYGTMEALNFGVLGHDAGPGPWIKGDLEDGVVSGGPSAGLNNPNNPTITWRFVTAVLKAATENLWSTRGGNAQSGSLATFYSGPRPNNYVHFNLTGGVVLGVGGDNSFAGQGTFYEGVMTASYPSNATEDAVQANIVAAGYAVAPLTNGAAVTVGSNITFRLTTPGLTSDYIVYNGSAIVPEVVLSSSPAALQQQATWTVRTGLANSGCVSFESAAVPGGFIYHNITNVLHLNSTQGTAAFNEGATFCPLAALSGPGNSIRAWNIPTRFFRQYHGLIYAAAENGSNPYDTFTGYNNDVSFQISSGFHS